MDLRFRSKKKRFRSDTYRLPSPHQSWSVGSVGRPCSLDAPVSSGSSDPFSASSAGLSDLCLMFICICSHQLLNEDSLVPFLRILLGSNLRTLCRQKKKSVVQGFVAGSLIPPLEVLSGSRRWQVQALIPPLLGVFTRLTIVNSTELPLHRFLSYSPNSNHFSQNSTLHI